MDIKARFFSLTPDRVLDAVEAGGVRVTGLCYPLNSLENRVYELERSDRTRVVAKFYRPGRWSPETILEEHRFLQQLHEAEIPVCPPLPFPNGHTLRTIPGIGIHYSLFPKVGGRAPEEFTQDQLRRLGALLARIHTVGAARQAPHRKSLTPTTYGREALQQLESSGFIPQELRGPLREVTQTLCDVLDPMFEQFPTHRLHGDCHPGNLLWGSQGPFFLDFDDLVIGPAVQDIWMVVPSRDTEGLAQREVLIEGYETLRTFDRRSLRLVEGLRALRYLHYAAWISRRWDDPSFPAAFPHFVTTRYFRELNQDLEEQLQLVQTAAAADPGMARVRPTSARKEDSASRFFDADGNRMSANASTPDAVSAAERGPSNPRTNYVLKPVTVQEDDWQRVLMIRTEVFVEELEKDIDLELDGQDKQAFHFLATLPDGRAGGCARVRSIPRRTDLVLDRLAVLYPHRKKGMGAALLKQAEDLARSRGGRLEIDAPADAIAYFEKHNYRKSGDGTMVKH